MASLFTRVSYSASSKSSTGLCENCGIRPKFQNHDYCGRTCSTAAETRRNSLAPAANAQDLPFSYGFSSRPNAPTTSNMCENCLWRAKSQEPDDDGTLITHPYCGIRCYQASQQTSWPASAIPAPAAAFASQELLTFRKERTTTPLGRKISLMMQERWNSDEFQIPKLKAVYRINLPGQIYRRFDLALQMNDGCPVRTTYYGGIAACSLADDANPTPCTSESCGLCDALRSSFSSLLHGESGSDGDYGPGLYTYANPALAYHATVSGDDLQPQGSNFALIQCRVVARADSVPSSNSYAGFIDDSGVAFCAQATAIIPTHILICNVPAPPKANQHTISVNSNSVSLGSAPSTASPIAGSIGQQVDLSDTGETRSNPVKGNKGKGKAQAKALPQKPQGKGFGLASSSKQHSGAGLTESAVANQGVLNPPQSGSSNAPQVVPAPKVMPSASTDAKGSAPPPPSSGESGAAGGHAPQAVYQSNVASPGPGQLYYQTQGGFLPLQNSPPPGLNLFVLGADGQFYPAPNTSATMAYPPIPPSTFSPVSAANRGLPPTPAPGTATSYLRMLPAKRQEQQYRMDEDDEDEDDFDELPDHPPGYHKPPPKR